MWMMHSWHVLWSCCSGSSYTTCTAAAVKAWTCTPTVVRATLAAVCAVIFVQRAYRSTCTTMCHTQWSQTKKALHTQRFFLNHMSNCRCSVHHYIFCEVGSGVTIVFTGSVVGAEHAATVRARTKPTTTFFIVCPFISLRLNIALRKRAAPSSAAQYIMR